MQWYYSKNGTQLGPIGDEEIKAKIASGEVAPTDLVWKDGMGDWLPAGQVQELRGFPVQPAAYGTGAVTAASNDPYKSPTPAAYGSTSYPGVGQDIPNYLWQSIVVTILCCWPLGIPAIVYAAKVDGLKGRGDLAGAIEASKNAKKWTYIALFSGLAVGFIWVFVGFGSAALQR